MADDEPSTREAADISRFLVNVVDITEAANWIAYGNFAGSTLGPKPLFYFIDESDHLTQYAFSEEGKATLALDLLWSRAESGEIRLFGHRAGVVETDGDPHWSKPDKRPEPIPREVIASGEWTEDDGGGVYSGNVSYWGIVVHYDDLMKWFPERGPSGDESAAQRMIDRATDSADLSQSRRTRAVASVETMCRKWIAELAAQDFTPNSRDELFRQALEKFPNGLSRRGFDRCWDNAAPDAWKRAGRKPRRD